MTLTHSPSLRFRLCGLLAFVVVGWTSTASANYPWRIPQGYTNRAAATGGRCGICHVSSAGGGARTAFGEAFLSNGRTWNRTLAELDSDGDGYSNGQELGDPWAEWTAASGVGDPPPPAVPAYVGVYYANPGVRSSQPAESTYNTCSSSLRNDCDANASCSRNSVNGIGDWDCTCDAGWDPTSRQGHTRSNLHSFTQGTNGHRLYNILNVATGCVDHDECSPNPCGPGSCSEGAPPTYTCACNTGYTFNGTTCVNVNECATMPGICGTGGTSCTDSNGSYSCTCSTGFVFNGTTCVVNNACDAGTDDCDIPEEATCTAVGTTSWNCTCNSGYTGFGSRFRGTGDDCRDNDECARTNPCGVGICTNTPGSYDCRCPSGYMESRGTCVDVDECLMDPCGVGGSRCTNSPGSYTCSCLPGYNFDGRTCTDINECAARPCGAGTCEETDPPGYSCTCDSGYEELGGTCVDIDECAAPQIMCSPDATCANTPGSFDCNCNAGYEGDGASCADIDECATGTDTCDPLAACENTVGSFTCTCPEGYQALGERCVDIDECAAGTGGCMDTERCVNVVGMPNECVCRPGLGRDDAGMCVTQCGNGERTPGEQCDDGNVDAEDGCDAGCQVESGWACFEAEGEPSECTFTCGDGLIDAPAEECDDEAANSDTEPDACRTNCQLAHCGDMVLDTGEACDDGDANSDEMADACRMDCTMATCGDGVVDTGEACDDGEATGACTSECTLGTGGDGGVSDGGMPDDASDGCGCRVQAADDRGAWAWALLIAGFAFRRRRRG